MTNTQTPLWKVLNEQRTQETWDVHSNNEIHPLSDEDGYTVIADFSSLDCETPITDQRQTEANAQYTALAVNNLAALAEALEELHKAAMRVGVIEWWQKHSETVAKAKEALNRIS